MDVAIARAIAVGHSPGPRRGADWDQLVDWPDARKEPDVVRATIHICPARPVRTVTAFVRSVPHAFPGNGTLCHPTMLVR
jgi:hypothetical protein